ncbi:hypothetical protein [Phenylobacterium sp.]|jgi:hypothetical protein|uniref:hypothetical protein n=1 Tax=Phenylobacterium sp. TaxID=1871053 RepID=UPI002F923404
MRTGLKVVLLGGAAVLAGGAAPQPQQKVTGPVATYWMSAQTHTGFGMPGAGGAPSPMQMMQMLRGGSVTRTLSLQLGSSSKPAGEASAEHLPPAGLKVGASLPLVTPKRQPAQKTEDTPPTPQDFQRPKGKMLIFWGCAERAKAGQPIVIDFAKMEPGKLPPGFEALSRGLNLTAMQPPSPGRNATYGEWPNEKTRTQVPGDGSLVGDHTVRGNYSPEIRFALSQAQDFLAPLTLTTNAKNPTGSGQLGWNAVPNAQAYLATAIGGGQDTVVLWTSSEVQSSAFSLPDYIAPGDVTRLVAAKALIGPQTTSCTVPKEVLDAAPQAMVQLAAYGPEANFVYPPRPSDPKAPWDRQWAVKVRYRSDTGGLLGQPMPGMGAGDEDAARPGRRSQPAQEQPPSKADRRRQIMKGLGGALGVPVPIP